MTAPTTGDPRVRLSLWASHILVGLALPAIVLLHLVPAFLAGFMVYVLANQISRHILSRVAGRYARVALSASIALAMVIGVGAGVVLLVNQLQVTSMDGLAGLWSRMADIVASAHKLLPAWLMNALPTTAEDVRQQVVQLLKEHTGQLQTLGKDVAGGLLHALVGSIVGGLLVVARFNATATDRPLGQALRDRIRVLALSFERVFLGQGKIALINATCTALYLLLALPLWNVHLPFAKTIVLLTLILGFIPVLGNLLSNLVIVVVSASFGLGVATASLVFLVLLHKAEYLLSARIVGTQIQAKTWELLTAMLVMEAAFGVPGLVVAPLFYAYLKAELMAAKLI